MVYAAHSDPPQLSYLIASDCERALITHHLPFIPNMLCGIDT